MAVLLVTACDGLQTQPNENGEIPPGACSVADNVQISRDGIAEIRRGFNLAVDLPYPVISLSPFDGTLMATTVGSDYAPGMPNAIYQTDAAVSSAAFVQEAYYTSTQARNSSVDGEWLYTGDAGLQAYEAGRITSATGVKKLPVPLLAAVSGGSFQATNTQVAYRAVIVRQSGSIQRTMMSAPSGRATIANATGSPQDVAVAVFGTSGRLTTGDALQFYRSVQSAGYTVDPGDELGLVYERTSFPEGAFGITNLSRTGSVVTATTNMAHGLQPGDYVNHSGATDFPAGDKLVVSVPGSTQFTYAEAGAATSSAVSLSATTVGIGFVDNVPDSLVGAALYTNATQEGIGQANEVPPQVLGDVAEFRRCAFYGYGKDAHRYSFRVLSVGSPDGIQVGDTVSVVWGTLTFSVVGFTSESATTFQVFTSGTPAENIANTAQSLARAITRRTSFLGEYTSGPTDVPGAITITSSPSAAFSVTFSRPGAFVTFGKTESESTTWKNRVYYSKVDQPEAVPLLNYFDVGDADQEILRLVPLRDSLVVLKHEGIYRITGDGPWNFRVDPFDLTVNSIAGMTTAALENTVFVLTTQGVVRIGDTGCTLISRPIEDQILPLLVDPMLSVVKATAFGVAHEGGRKYLLWLPTADTDTTAKVAFVYDLFTETWARWIVEASAAVFNPADSLLYIANGTQILRERKSYTSADYQDFGGDGGSPIPADIEWTPKFGDRPDMLHHFREAGLLLGTAEYSTATLGFATDLDPTMEYVTLPAAESGQLVRVSVPRKKQRGSRLKVRFSQNEAAAALQIKGLRVVYETTGERVRR